MKPLLVLFTSLFLLMAVACCEPAFKHEELSYRVCVENGWSPPCCTKKTVEACTLVPPGKVR